MSTEANKALVRRWVAAWNSNTNFEEIDQIFAQDWIDRNPIPGGPQGIEGAIHFVRVFRNAFSEIDVAIDTLMAEGDMVMFRFIVNATHKGEFQGLPPTGKHVMFSGITIHRVAGGKFAESVNEIDFFGLFQQLGAPPAP
jgi:steroid delta-isomerase-like uncharacterized protein